MFNTHEIIVCLVYKKKSPKGDENMIYTLKSFLFIVYKKKSPKGDENGDLSPLLFTLFRVYKKKSPKGDENKFPHLFT